jgi:hypothetical protein
LKKVIPGAHCERTAQWSTAPHQYASSQRKNALPQICLEGQCVLVDDIGLENRAETRVISFFDPKATPNPTLLSQWILKTYSSIEINELILLIDQ